MNGHNHPPSCCCAFDPRDIEEGDTADRLYPLITCPACIEHGELAQLGDNNTLAPGGMVCPRCLSTRYAYAYCSNCGWPGPGPREAACVGTAPAPPNTADAPPPPTTGATATPAPDAAATASPATASPAPDEPHA